MAQRERSTLKNFFQTGDKPSQTQYSDLIDSGVYTQEQNNVSNTEFRLDNSSDQALVGLERSGTQVFSELSWNYTGGKPISASGDISVSGNVIANEITASGNISASGLISSTVSASSTVHSTFIRLPQDGQGGGQEASIYFGNSPVDNVGKIYDDGSSLVLGYNDSDVVQINNNKTIISNQTIIGGGGDIKLGVGGSTAMNIPEKITVEGNISASGTIIAAGFNFGSNVTASYSNINVSGNITASGEISSSGTLTTGTTIQLGGNHSDNIRLKNYIQGGIRLSTGDGGTTYLEVGNSLVVINLSLIPTSDPNTAGQLFRDGTDLKISLG